ncbi:MBL fold metallo-hydrolase [Planctomycetota bacterium]|nr:MBL fold metallo-hydrolase [Planctomycetota bacterium]
MPGISIPDAARFFILNDYFSLTSSVASPHFRNKKNPYITEPFRNLDLLFIEEVRKRSKMFARQIVNEQLSQVAYLIGCQKTGEAILIDPLRDVEQYVQIAEENKLKIIATLDTHIHADYLSGGREISNRFGVKVFVSGEGGEDWFPRWVSQDTEANKIDHQVLHDGDSFNIGKIQFSVIHTPGHTPEHLSLLVTDVGGGANEPIALISGDFLFVGDLGRPDLLETAAGQIGSMLPSAQDLLNSLTRISDLPDFVQVWPGHGAGSSCGKDLGAIPTSTLGYERRFNRFFQLIDDPEEFVKDILSGQPEPPGYFSEMKRLNRDGVPLIKDIPEPKYLSGQQFIEHYRSGKQVIDTRNWDQFRDTHLVGAWSVPMESRIHSYVGSFIDIDQEILLVIDSKNIVEVLARLHRVGYERVVGWISDEDLFSLPSSDVSFTQVSELNPETWIENVIREEISVLDVRKKSEVSLDPVPGAIHFAHTQIVNNLSSIDQDEDWFVLCETGDRSARTCSFLRSRGFKATNLIGGVEEFRKGVRV